VIPPVGEAKPNEVVFALIGRALGFEETEFHEGSEGLARRIVAAVEGPIAGERTLEGLRVAGRLGFDFPGPSPVQFSTVFPNTEGRKVRLFPPELGDGLYQYQEDPGTPEYPLALISPATSKTTSSTMGEYNLPEAFLEIHPEDAGPRRIADRDWVRIYNKLGEVEVRARLSARIRPGVVSLPKGMWRKAARNGRVATALVPDTITPVSGGACFNDARVQVARLPA
jgi:anaerobic selenocysteine-containing dehydrogenase